MKRLIPTVRATINSVLPALCLLAVVLGCGMRSDSDWQKVLGDKKLSRASNSGSISDKVDIYFCPTGDYAMVTQFSGFSPGGSGTLSMADENTEVGKWSVNSSTLVLHPNEGKTHEYALSQGQGEDVIVLDGNGYLVGSHNECGN